MMKLTKYMHQNMTFEDFGYRLTDAVPAALRACPEGENAAIIGVVTEY